jgi:hypothetical protein
MKTYPSAITCPGFFRVGTTENGYLQALWVTGSNPVFEGNTLL